MCTIHFFHDFLSEIDDDPSRDSEDEEEMKPTYKNVDKATIAAVIVKRWLELSPTELSPTENFLSELIHFIK